MKITCPGCRAEVTILGGYIERMRREGKPVRCPNSFCRYVLIKNKEADDDHPTSA